MSGPPYETTVRSRSGERRISRTIDMGLRREPQPPMPMVMPSRNWATTSSSVSVLSGTKASLRELGVALVDERVARLVGHARQVELEGEALLEAVAALHVDGVDAVERFLG